MLPQAAAGALPNPDHYPDHHHHLHEKWLAVPRTLRQLNAQPIDWYRLPQNAKACIGRADCQQHESSGDLEHVSRVLQNRGALRLCEELTPVL